MFKHEERQRAPQDIAREKLVGRLQELRNALTEVERTDKLLMTPRVAYWKKLRNGKNGEQAVSEKQDKLIQRSHIAQTLVTSRMGAVNQALNLCAAVGVDPRTEFASLRETRPDLRGALDKMAAHTNTGTDHARGSDKTVVHVVAGNTQGLVALGAGK